MLNLNLICLLPWGKRRKCPSQELTSFVSFFQQALCDKDRSSKKVVVFLDACEGGIGAKLSTLNMGLF